jgi:branched-chain amino acid transport system ATP-binding protein
MLRLESLSLGYGEMTAVHGLTLNVLHGEITALLGANGAGKSSTIMCIAGHVSVMEGRIFYREKDITRVSPMARVKAGIALVPEGRRLFPGLTVRENLIVGGYSQPRGLTRAGIDEILDLFPPAGRKAGTGGRIPVRR